MNDPSSPIKIVSTNESLKIIGELLSNESSRMIIRALIDNEMYANEIATKLNLRPNLVVHHLNKMESLNLLEITHKNITKKGIKHKHYRMQKGLLVVPEMHKEDIKDGFMQSLFKKGAKFVMIGIAGIMPVLVHVIGTVGDQRSDHDIDLLSSDSIILGLAIVITGLIIEKIYTYRKNKRPSLG